MKFCKAGTGLLMALTLTAVSGQGSALAKEPAPVRAKIDASTEKKSATAKDEAAFNKLVKDERSAEQARDYGRAEKLSNKAIAEAEKFGSDDLRLADSYATLGDLLFNHTDRLEDARTAYKRANLIYQKKIGPTGSKSMYMIAQLVKIMDKLDTREKLKKKKEMQEARRKARLEASQRLLNQQAAPARTTTIGGTTSK